MFMRVLNTQLILKIVSVYHQINYTQTPCVWNHSASLFYSIRTEAQNSLKACSLICRPSFPCAPFRVLPTWGSGESGRHYLTIGLVRSLETHTVFKYHGLGEACNTYIKKKKNGLAQKADTIHSRSLSARASWNASRFWFSYSRRSSEPSKCIIVRPKF